MHSMTVASLEMSDEPLLSPHRHISDWYDTVAIYDSRNYEVLIDFQIPQQRISDLR